MCLAGCVSIIIHFPCLLVWLTGGVSTRSSRKRVLTSSLFDWQEACLPNPEKGGCLQLIVWLTGGVSIIIHFPCTLFWLIGDVSTRSSRGGCRPAHCSIGRRRVYYYTFSMSSCLIDRRRVYKILKEEGVDQLIVWLTGNMSTRSWRKKVLSSSLFNWQEACLLQNIYSHLIDRRRAYYNTFFHVFLFDWQEACLPDSEGRGRGPASLCCSRSTVRRSIK